jgi:hypothetical protein
MSKPEWVGPVQKDDERAVRALLERQPPAFKLTDTVRSPDTSDGISVYEPHVLSSM